MRSQGPSSPTAADWPSEAHVHEMRVTGKQQDANVHIQNLVMAPTEQQKCSQGARGALLSNSGHPQAAAELLAQGTGQEP